MWESQSSLEYMYVRTPLTSLFDLKLIILNIFLRNERESVLNIFAKLKMKRIDRIVNKLFKLSNKLHVQPI